MIELLEKWYAWVMFAYKDGSSKLFVSTLNADICNELGVELRDDSLYDFNKKEYVEIPDPEKVKLLVSVDKPALSEVNEFANQFI